MWELLQLLHFTVDHSDGKLHYTSQFIHCLQVFNGIRAASFGGVDAAFKETWKSRQQSRPRQTPFADRDEEEHHVDCMNRVIGPLPTTARRRPRTSRSNGITTSTATTKLAAVRPKLPERVLASVRFHSLREATGADTIRIGRGLAFTSHRQTSTSSIATSPTTTESSWRFVLEMRKFDYLDVRIPAVDVKYIQALLLQYFTQWRHGLVRAVNAPEEFRNMQQGERRCVDPVVVPV